MAKAITLMSGGLDSSLAARLMLEQGIEVEGVHFLSVFNLTGGPGRKLSARLAADALGVPLKLIDFTKTQLEILRNPPHGFGSAVNPCIDCHIAMLRGAAGRMEETGADFIVTGEVVGQRPMSQRTHALAIIDAETGLGDKILRPLSARALEPTPMEKKGLVDRNRLEDIRGRARSRQMAMAKRFGLTSYPSPAGGCLLTDPGFGRRLKDLLAHDQLNLNDAHLLKVGRHYRLDEKTKVIVGRNERDNGIIETFAQPGDLLVVLKDITGPTTLLRGDASNDNLLAAGALAARCSKAKRDATARVKVRGARSDGAAFSVDVTPATTEFARSVALNTSEGK